VLRRRHSYTDLLLTQQDAVHSNEKYHHFYCSVGYACGICSWSCFGLVVSVTPLQWLPLLLNTAHPKQVLDKIQLNPSLPFFPLPFCGSKTSESGWCSHISRSYAASSVFFCFGGGRHFRNVQPHPTAHL
jgi:hypothetical protein